MKHVYSKLAITLFGFAALSSYAQTDNNQSVTVNGRIVNSATAVSYTHLIYHLKKN